MGNMYVFLSAIMTKPKTKFIPVGQTEADRSKFSVRTSYFLTCISLGSEARFLFIYFCFTDCKFSALSSALFG